MVSHVPDHMPVDHSLLLLICIHQCFFADSIDHPRDPSGYPVDFFLCVARKEFSHTSRIIQMRPDIFAYGPVIRDRQGRKIQTYLSTVIDDHSRMIIQSEWYDNQRKGIVEDTVHKAVLKHGVFDRL